MTVKIRPQRVVYTTQFSHALCAVQAFGRDTQTKLRILYIPCWRSVET
jgi:hypothetical protein